MEYLFVIKKIAIGIILILLFLVCCKLSIFYIPFIIAYIISIMIDPIIKWVNRKTSFSRKTASIIVLISIFIILAIIIGFAVVKLISEATNLLNGLNTYLEKTMNFVTESVSKINLKEWNTSKEVISVFETSANDFLNTITDYIKTILNKCLKYVTSIPNMFINIIITALATYFITTDKFYILDRMEHQFSKKMMGKVITHTKEITTSLGGYLKAEITLSFITFIIVLIGLNLFYFLGMDIEYPLLMAILIGFIDALPILGAGSIMVPWTAILFVTNNNSLAFSVLGLYIFTVVAKQLLEPKLVSNNIGIHPIFTLLAMYTSFKIIGVIGLLVGPIILIVLKNVFAEVLDKGIVNSIFDI